MVIGYNHWTEKGNSGGPLLLSTTNKTFEIIGIHKAKGAHFNIGLPLRCLSKVVEALKGLHPEEILSKSLKCYNPSMNSEV